LIAVAGVVAFYKLNDQKEKLQAASEQLLQDQQNHAMAVYEQIEANLASIREHESTISSNFTGTELSSEMLPEERIQNEINFIKNLIDENNKLIASLNEKIDLKDKRIAGYDRTVKDLQARISGYQVQLDQLVAEKAVIQAELDKNIADKNALASQVDLMGNEIVQKSSIIEDQQKQMVDKENVLHTAYYKVGTYKTLRDQNVLQKEGGVLGINSVMTVVGSPDPGLFQAIDTREITRIPVLAKRCEIASGQDPSSYKLEMDGDQVEWLTITNADKFWSKSKYLVIVVRDNDFDEVALYR
jgi:flagellar biosynthesis chaperone FliJ